MATVHSMEGDTFGSDVDEAGGSEVPKFSVHKLSCDQCRQRKIRCDRVDPCGPCSRKAIQCSYPAGFKPRAKRQRALVSDGYETKLDDLSRKLDRISLAVDNIESTLAHRDGSAPNVHNDPAAHSTPLSYTSSSFAQKKPCDDASSELESDAILTTQATFAATFAQEAVDSNHLLHASYDVKSSLDALRNVVTELNSNDTIAKSLDIRLVSPIAGQNGFNLPPMQLAMAAIQKLKESPRLRFFWCLELENIGQFVEYFMTVYSGTPTVADLIIVHCGLHNLLVGYGNMEPDEALKNEFKSKGMLCRRNLETILVNLPLNLPPTFDFVLALLMASTYYLEKCRMSLSWNYLTNAAQMCLTLGYHRDQPRRPEKKEARQRRIRLFWLVYMIDKLLSLRLSRPSLLRDGDITVPLPCEDAVGECLNPIIPKWVKVSRLQGKVYDGIYSPGALLRPKAVREARARELAAELHALYDIRDPVENQFFEGFRDDPQDFFYEVIARADKISHLAILTLIYRSIQPSFNTSSAFCDECLSTAKDCLEEHNRCLSLLKDAEPAILQLYVQWAILSAPFVPFIVLFCHAIETRDESHLESLSAVVEVLEILPPDLPDAYSKQRRLFKLMYNVACKFVGASGSGNPAAQPSGLIPDTPFEMLFTEAGISVPSQMQMHAGMQSFHGQMEQGPGMQFGDMGVGQGGFGGDVEASNHGAELGIWFEQNHQIFKMLEDPF